MTVLERAIVVGLFSALITVGCNKPRSEPATMPSDAKTSPIPTHTPAPAITPITSAPTITDTYSEFAGEWRIFSARLFYDEGGAGDIGVSDTITRRLVLTPEGTWRFGPASGRFLIEAIEAEDWARWDVEPYGPQRKITLLGWNGEQADGPVEESEGKVDFFWVIYRVEPPTVEAPGTAWLKMGHS